MKKICFSLFILISLFLLSYGEDQRVFIRNFRSTEVDSAQCSALTNLFASELKGLVKWEIITYEDLSAMIDQEIDKQLLDCNDNSCMEEIAGALGAPLVISGDITKFGSYYIINISLLNIVEGKALEKASDKVKNIDTILERIVLLAQKIAGTGDRFAAQSNGASQKEPHRKDVKSPESSSFIKIIHIDSIDSADVRSLGNHYGMKLIPSGFFDMGSNSGAEDEKPLHRVKVASFWMDSTEVTQKEYFRVMGKNPSLFGGEHRPVENVTWWDAIRYCNARSREVGLTPCYDEKTGRIDKKATGFRLPTEAEWEYACRGGRSTKYYWGDSEIGLYAWYNNNSMKRTQMVAKKGTHPFGLYDMSGNVWEWCHDTYLPYGNELSKTTEDTTVEVARVTRGGSFLDLASQLRSGNRSSAFPYSKGSSIGFRSVLSVIK